MSRTKIGPASVLATVVITTVLFEVGRTPADALAQDSSIAASSDNTLVVFYGSNTARPFSSLVELFRDGKRLRSRQLRAGHSVKWTDLRDGQYEVHCSAPDYPKAIYRILVSKKDVTELSVKMNKDKPVVVGGGPTIAELLKQLTMLKSANTDLHKRVGHLEAEVSELKKASSPE